MARVVVGESPDEMRFGDFLEEFIFMVFRIEKLLRRIDYFQEPDEILIQDTARMEPDQQPELGNEEQQEERGYEICTVMEDSNEDENEESGSSSRRNQRRSNHKSPMLTDANQLLSSALGNEMLAPNFHGRSSFDATQSQDSQSEQHRSLGDVTSEREGNKGFVGIMTPEKRISLKGGPPLYPNIPLSHIEEGGSRSLSASSQKRGGHSNVNDLLNSLRKSTEIVSPAYRYQALHNQSSVSATSREISPNKREADHLIEEIISQTPRGLADSNMTHRKDKISGSKDDSFSRILDHDSPNKSLSQDALSEEAEPQTTRVAQYGLSHQMTAGTTNILPGSPDETKNSKVRIIENLESQIYDLMREAKKVATSTKQPVGSFLSTSTIGYKETKASKQQQIRPDVSEVRQSRNSVKPDTAAHNSHSPHQFADRRFEKGGGHGIKTQILSLEKHLDLLQESRHGQAGPSKIQNFGAGLLKIKGQLAVAHGGHSSLIDSHLLGKSKLKQQSLPQGSGATYISKSSVIGDRQTAKSRETSDILKKVGLNSLKPLAVTQYHPVSKQEKRLISAIQTITTPLFKSTEHVKHIKLKVRQEETDTSRGVPEVDRRSIVSEQRDSQSIQTTKTGPNQADQGVKNEPAFPLSPGPIEARVIPRQQMQKQGHKTDRAATGLAGPSKASPSPARPHFRHQAGLSNLTQLSGNNPHFDSYLEEKSNAAAERSCSIPLSDQQSRKTGPEKVLPFSRDEIFVTADGFLLPERTDSLRLRGSFDGVRGLEAALQAHAKKKPGNTSARSNGRSGAQTDRGLFMKDHIHESPALNKKVAIMVKQRDNSADAGLQSARKQEIRQKVEIGKPPQAQKLSSSFIQPSANTTTARPRTSSSSAVSKMPMSGKVQKPVPARSVISPTKPSSTSAQTPRLRPAVQQPNTFKPSSRPLDLDGLQKKLKVSVGSARRREPSKLERSVHL